LSRVSSFVSEKSFEFKDFKVSETSSSLQR